MRTNDPARAQSILPILLTICVWPATAGVVVEKVSTHAAGLSSELKKGDVLLNWCREAQSGELSSPLDLAIVEIEQSPKGAVRISGLRNEQPMAWDVRLELWELETSPVEAGPGSSPHVRSWLQFRAAEAAAKKSDWDECDSLYLSASREPGTSNAVRSWLLRAWGASFSQRFKPAEAELKYREATALSEAAGKNSLSRALSIRALGSLARSRGDLANAEALYREALEIRTAEAPDSLDAARSLNDLGAVAQDRNEVAKSRGYYERSLAIEHKLAPASLDVARNLIGLGYSELYRDLPKAEELYLEALAIQTELAPASLHVAQSLQSLGLVKHGQGQFARAEEYYEKALAIQRAVAPRRLDTGKCLLNLGNTIQARGENGRAKQMFQEALSIFEERAPGSLDSARVLTSLGNVARAQGALADAESHHSKSLSIKRELLPGSLSVAVSLINLGNIFEDRGDIPAAEKSQLEALRIFEKLAPGSGSHATILFNLGGIAFRGGRLETAEGYYRRANEFEERIAPESGSHAESLRELARVLTARGDFAAAGVLFERAVSILDVQVSRLGGSEDLRAVFRAKYAGYYRDYIELLVASGQPDGAFHVLERSRARSFLALVAERTALLARNLPAAIEAARQKNAVDYDRIQAQLFDANSKGAAAQVERLRGQLQDLAGERGRIVEEVRRASPQLASVQYPQPLTLAAARDAMAGGTAVIAFSAGQKSVTVFAVSADRSRPIETRLIPIGEKELRKRVLNFRASIEDPKPESQSALRQEAKSLYELLLKPSEALIGKSERILLVPDGPLHMLPFAALVRTEGDYLIEWRPLHTAVSLTAYAELRKPPAQRSPYTWELAAFGDPVYPRLETSTSGSVYGLRTTMDRGLQLRRLPFSRAEVESIARLYPGTSQTFLGISSTENQAKALNGRARYVHFAAHGFYDERFPLDSAIVLSIPGRAAEGQDNGLLQAWEIMATGRMDCELVVLSACQTGLGQELGGEGLIGLTRALQYAGARAVVASLWSVDDRRTADLMRRFYVHLKGGKHKDEALRAAQVEVLKNPLSRRPIYWAAFTLSGDWR